jgi:hypothetical protein
MWGNKFPREFIKEIHHNFKESKDQELMHLDPLYMFRALYKDLHYEDRKWWKKTEEKYLPNISKLPNFDIARISTNDHFFTVNTNWMQKNKPTHQPNGSDSMVC